ncbi:MAG: LCP family protein [Oscillospiraceae bacterium]
MSQDKNGFTDDFEDLYSSSSDDKFEDIKSSSDGFEDFFTGREEDTNLFDEDLHINIKKSEPAKSSEQPASPELHPYSYNYDAPNRKIKREAMDEVYEDINSGKGKKPKKESAKKSSGKIVGSIIASLLAIVLIVTGSLGVYVYSYSNKLLKAVNTVPLVENKYVTAGELFHDDNIKNILLIGVDAREGENPEKTRSDTMMIVSIDSKNKQIKITSILRDSYVQLPSTKKWNKINSAPVFGGVQLLVDTIECNFKIDIDNYMFVSFEMFTTIVDKLGGVDVEVTEKESYYTYHSGAIGVPVRIEAGESVHLNGEQALWYCRIRYLDSDFMRTKRQRKVINSLFQKVKSEKLSTLMKMGEGVASMVQTDLNKDEIKSLALNAAKYFKYDIIQQEIPAEGTWKSQNKGAVGNCLVMDLKKNSEILKNFIEQKAVIEKPVAETEKGSTQAKK